MVEYIVIIVFWALIIFALLIAEIYTSVFTGIIASSALIPLVLSILAGENNAILWLAYEIPTFVVLISIAISIVYFVFWKKQKQKDIFARKEFLKKIYLLKKDSINNPENIDEYGEIYIDGILYRTKNELKYDFLPKGTKVQIVKMEGNTVVIKKGSE